MKNILLNNGRQKECCDCRQLKYYFQFPTINDNKLGIFDVLSDRCNACFEQKELFKSKKTEYTLKEREKMSPKYRFEVLKKDNFTCQYCGKTVKDGIKLCVDHIIPICDGGDSSFENLITSCTECNSGKSGFSKDIPDIRYISKKTRTRPKAFKRNSLRR